MPDAATAVTIVRATPAEDAGVDDEVSAAHRSWSIFFFKCAAVDMTFLLIFVLCAITVLGRRAH
jgi:hypothetical protein